MRGSPNVSEERRTAVLQAAEELGYRPNAVARSLVSRRSGVLGLVLSDLHNPFFADVADGIEEQAVHKGYRALLSSGFLDADREAQAVDTLLQLRVDGLLLLGTAGPIERFEDAARSIPIVSMSRHTTTTVMDSVRSDDSAGVALLVDHLVELGHRRIAHITAVDGAGGPARLQGYRQAMETHGLGSEIRVTDGAFTQAAGRDAMSEIIESGDLPTAVLAPNDYAALGVLEAADAAGVAVPDDVSVTGYDNMAFARMQRVSLTTVEQPAAEIGRTATDLLLERVDEGRTEARHVVLPPTLVIGATTARPRD